MARTLAPYDEGRCSVDEGRGSIICDRRSVILRLARNNVDPGDQVVRVEVEVALPPAKRRSGCVLDQLKRGRSRYITFVCVVGVGDATYLGMHGRRETGQSQVCCTLYVVAEPYSIFM
jgi:hypothetical protein